MAKDGTMSQETTIWAGQKIGENMSTKDDQGKLEVSVRILGNELVALKMTVDDFKMKWLVLGVITIVALGWAARVPLTTQIFFMAQSSHLFHNDELQHGQYNRPKRLEICHVQDAYRSNSALKNTHPFESLI